MAYWVQAYGGTGLVKQPMLSVALWEPPQSEPFVMYGRMAGPFDPARCPQAKLTATTVCAVCGKGFTAGDGVRAELAIPPAEGTWRHDYH
jgi:hypothetical protein